MPYFEDELDALSPEDFERDLSLLPAFDLPDLPTEAWTAVAIAEIGLVLSLPAGHVVHGLDDAQVPNVHEWAAKIEPDTTLVVQYVEDIPGYPNYVIQVEDGEQLSEVRYSFRMAGLPAELRMIRYRAGGIEAFCAAMNTVIRRGAYLGAAIMSSSEVGIVTALTALARSRFILPA